jgi:tRNA-binding EMAP/Myf-like protein
VTNQPAPAVFALGCRCEENGLSDYAEGFEAAGYDAADAFASMTIEEATSVAEDEVGMDEEATSIFLACYQGKNDRFKGFKVGVILTKEGIKGKDKLNKLTVDVGGEEPLPIVTNAKVSEGERVVVATVGAKIGEDDDAIVVTKANVGGAPSHGMLCDGPMLGWGGTVGSAAIVPDTFEVGAAPPDSKPAK